MHSRAPTIVVAPPSPTNNSSGNTSSGLELDASKVRDSLINQQRSETSHDDTTACSRFRGPAQKQPAVVQHRIFPLSAWRTRRLRLSAYGGDRSPPRGHGLLRGPHQPTSALVRCVFCPDRVEGSKIWMGAGMGHGLMVRNWGEKL